MKKLFILLIMFTPFISCEKFSLNDEEFKSVCNEPHKLRKFSTTTEKYSHSNFSYFLIMGSGSYESRESTSVKLWCEVNQNSNEYIFMNFDLNKIIVLFDDTNNPHITINWKFSNIVDTNLKECVVRDRLYNIDSITVHCKESDFPVNINIDSMDRVRNDQEKRMGDTVK